MIYGVDPVEMGLVASLNRPGGNLTGVTGLSVELVPKRLELLHELVPAATVMALLVNPTNPNSATQTRDVQAAARRLGLALHVLNAAGERDFEAVFAELARLKAGALVVGADGLFVRRGEELGALAVSHRVPAIFQDRAFAAGGGLSTAPASPTPIAWSASMPGACSRARGQPTCPCTQPACISLLRESVVQMVANSTGNVVPNGTLALAVLTINSAVGLFMTTVMVSWFISLLPQPKSLDPHDSTGG